MSAIDSLIDAWRYTDKAMRTRKSWRKNSLKYYRSERGKFVSVAYRKKETTKQERAAYHKKYYETPESRAQILHTVAKGRAIAKKLEFSIPLHQIIHAFQIGTCEVTGIPFDFGSRPDGCRVHPWGPSIDRIDNSRGYVIGNVQVVCNAFNLAKNDFPEHVVYALAQALVKQKSEEH